MSYPKPSKDFKHPSGFRVKVYYDPVCDRHIVQIEDPESSSGVQTHVSSNSIGGSSSDEKAIEHAIQSGVQKLKIEVEKKKAGDLPILKPGKPFFFEGKKCVLTGVDMETSYGGFMKIHITAESYGGVSGFSADEPAKWPSPMKKPWFEDLYKEAQIGMGFPASMIGDFSKSASKAGPLFEDVIPNAAGLGLADLVKETIALDESGVPAAYFISPKEADKAKSLFIQPSNPENIPESALPSGFRFLWVGEKVQPGANYCLFNPLDGVWIGSVSVNYNSGSWDGFMDTLTVAVEIDHKDPEFNKPFPKDSAPVASSKPSPAPESLDLPFGPRPRRINPEFIPKSDQSISPEEPGAEGQCRDTKAA